MCLDAECCYIERAPHCDVVAFARDHGRARLPGRERHIDAISGMSFIAELLCPGPYATA